MLLTRANTPDLVGDCAIVGRLAHPTIFSDLMYRLRFEEDALDPRFLLFVLRSEYMRSQIERDARGSSMSMAKLSHGHIKAWKLCVPPLQQQQQIADAIEVQEQKLVSLTTEAELACSLLGERRAALISAAVTGKIDVREEAARATEAA